MVKVWVPRCGSWTSTMLLALIYVGVAGLFASPAAAQEPGGGIPFQGAVGIKVTPTAIRLQSLEADFDLAMYTRLGPYPSTYAGVPTFGIPAIDYGDGSTLSTTTLVLASSGGGPGGSNVYRNLASLTHTYPSGAVYKVTASSYCTFCFRLQYVFFPPGSPVPPAFTASVDYVPQTVIGNLAARYTYNGTTSFEGTSVHYHSTYYGGVTNTARVNLFNVLAVPTVSTWGLALLGALLLLSGLIVLRST